MLEGLIKKIFGDPNEKELKNIRPIVDKINALEPDMERMSDANLQAKTSEFKLRLKKGETLDDILPEAFAVVREASKRVTGMRHFDVQLIGGVVLHRGKISEMRTGEGKTLVATLPVYLNALTGKGVHVVTVNDYLARRDSIDMGRIYNFLGLSVGLIVHEIDFPERKAAYQADITYGTNNEFGFDYLRDNMVVDKDQMVQRELNYCIVDEVDSILIDEARTPLIISGPGEKSADLYKVIARIVANMKEGEDYTVDEKQKQVAPTEAGIAKAEKALGVSNLYDTEHGVDFSHHIMCAIKAKTLMIRDRDYVVKDGEVIIVDEFTGRLMYGRRYSEGLHQAIEAKEHVKVERESKTLATITFQNYFRMYKKLSGMTGTAKTEEPEFQGIYSLDVVEIPTNRPNIRKDLEDMVYKNKNAKFQAVLNSIEEHHATHQPVLVGTISVEISEMLSSMLKRRGILHEVLNAKNHAKEAEIVAQAGRWDAVTIATNMAGRGTDILLGGNPEFMARRALHQETPDLEDEVIEEAVGHSEHVSEEVLAVRKRYNDLYARFKAETDAEHERVLKTGGLHIIGTERHESRRIDNQLRGRSGRQGDPGSTQFFISLEDDLMRLFGSERIGVMVDRLGLKDDEPLTAGLLTKQIESAQKRIEGRNFEARKHVLEYDNVMNRQREVIYGQRRRVLMGENVKDSIMRMADHVIDFAAGRWMNGEDPQEWEWREATNYLENLCCHHGIIEEKKALADAGDRDEFIAALKEDARAFYAEREKMLEEIRVDMREVERVMLLRSVDSRWMDHIDAMDQLRDGIGFRAYSGKNPVTEYQIEASHMFEELNHLIREDTVRRVYQTKVQVTPERVQTAKPTEARLAGDGPRQPRRVKASQKVGRNDPCPCGSGKKYKNCCGRNTDSDQ